MQPHYPHSWYSRGPVRPPLFESGEIIAVVGVLLIIAFAYLVGRRYHLTDRQMAEIATYAGIGLVTAAVIITRLATMRSRHEKKWPRTPVVIQPARDERLVQEAWGQNAVVLGYDVHGKPWLWPDKVRVMQGVVLGMTGAGKTTLLRNIITQDLARSVGPPEDRHKVPLVIFDGKGDLEFFYSLVPHIHHAGRLPDLRLLNPARPDLSVLYNPFYAEDAEDYMSQVNMVFGSFNLRDEFFGPHQRNYLADIVRVLTYTGKRYNFYDVIVMALDEHVLHEQVEKATKRIERDHAISQTRRLNFEASVRNLFQSLHDRERVPKIQGLLNECMTFLDDELSVITGPYEDLLSIDEVIDRELILFVTLNVNKNTEPVRALGKMLLQNLQLVVGKRYQSEEHRRRSNRPVFSVVLDEFAPFGYSNFAQILQTARGTNTAFLFSMQSLPQLMRVGRGFKDEVTSAPNTVMTLRTRDEETSRYFIRASAEQTVQKRTFSLARQRIFAYERYEKTGSATERDEQEFRARDEHIKNLPKGRMEVLMTDDTRGTLHGRLCVRAPAEVRPPLFEPELYPRLRHSRAESQAGANLRFKNAELSVRYRRFGQGRLGT